MLAAFLTKVRVARTPYFSSSNDPADSTARKMRESAQVTFWNCRKLPGAVDDLRLGLERPRYETAKAQNESTCVVKTRRLFCKN